MGAPNFFPNPAAAFEIIEGLFADIALRARQSFSYRLEHRELRHAQFVSVELLWWFGEIGGDSGLGECS
jgi:hypothetical protein